MVENSIKTSVDQIADRSAHDHRKRNQLPFRKFVIITFDVEKNSYRGDDRKKREKYLHRRNIYAEGNAGIFDIGYPENIIDKRTGAAERYALQANNRSTFDKQFCKLIGNDDYSGDRK